VRVRELKVARQIRLLYPSQRTLSRAARAFVDLVRGGRASAADRGEAGPG
jgi:hypothetical protein